MEIEAKFTLPDAVTIRRAKTVERIGAFALGKPKVIRTTDTFLDTSARRLLAEKYALRWRKQSDGKIVLTCKGVPTRQGSMYRRMELETELPANSKIGKGALEKLPRGELREFLQEQVGDARLEPLITIRQTRVVRPVRHARRVIAEWSVDHVRIKRGTRVQKFDVLEIELKREDAGERLIELVRQIEAEWKLEPEPRSKFERAMQM